MNMMNKPYGNEQDGISCNGCVPAPPSPESSSPCRSAAARGCGPGEGDAQPPAPGSGSSPGAPHTPDLPPAKQ